MNKNLDDWLFGKSISNLKKVFNILLILQVYETSHKACVLFLLSLYIRQIGPTFQ